MMQLGDTPFRMPSSYYDPPEPEVWTCQECGAVGNESDACDECGADFDSAHVDPYDAYEDHLNEMADNLRDDPSWGYSDD